MAGIVQSNRLPCPYTILVNDREQRPYTFQGLHADDAVGNRPLAVTTKRAKLIAGDYSIENYDKMVCVEVKSLADIAATMTVGRKRFKDELLRLREYDAAWIVVESELSQLWTGAGLLSLTRATSIFRGAMLWQLRYPSIRWWAVPGRARAEQVTYHLLATWYRERVEGPAKYARIREEKAKREWAKDVPSSRKVYKKGEQHG